MSTSTDTTSTDSGDPPTIAGTITSADGGDLEIEPDNPMVAPGAIQMTDYGAAFGPLELIAYPESTVTVGGLEFVAERGFFDGLFGSGDSGGLFGAAALIGATEHNDAIDRRDALKAMAGLGTVAALSAPARADTATRTQAQFSVTDNPAGLRVRVRDRTEAYLPTDTSYYVYVNSAEYSQFTAANTQSYGDVLPELTGTVVVGPEGSGGSFLERLTADTARTYEGLTLTRTDGSVVDDVATTDTGTKLTVTNNDVMVEAAQQAGAGETTMAINGESIPHRHESADDAVGYYQFQDGAVQYVVGSDAPSGQTATLALYVDRVDELLDDVGRWS